MRLTGLWWWIDRWRKSTAYMDMTVEEQGAYRNLLDEASLRGGPLPNDERVLAKACGDVRIWRKVRRVVMARFTLAADGWRNETLDSVLNQSVRRATNQANYRKRRDNKFNNGGNNGGDNKAASPDPDPDPDPKKEKKEKIAAAPLDPPFFRRFWIVFPKHVGEKETRELWVQLAPNEVFADTIQAGAVAYAAYVLGWQAKYIKAPLKWLEGAHWEDELAAVAVKTRSKTSLCPHDPPCARLTECTKKIIEDGRKERTLAGDEA